ncbi:response regulator [Aureimonas endophytica]|uniref:Response regulator n=1 Tax=Aureimonas endophytica TaxID=2027858 RepID=A0A916ZP89_9HYPH|nr:response regulator [Aureimonas endophytica]GGE07258.1 response regulator [Aureimonas endophytica]
MGTIDRHAVALVAEDEPLLRMEAADTLEEAGFTVLEAATSDAALRHLEAHGSIELLFTDIEMPGPIDGIGLAREVAQRWPGVSIVVCSGRYSLQPGDLPRQARFIAKPFTPDLMIQAIETAMR